MRVSIVLVLVLLASCASESWMKFENVSPSQLTAETLVPGDKLVLEYADGTTAELTVDHVLTNAIVSVTGVEYPKENIKTLHYAIPADKADKADKGGVRGLCFWEELVFGYCL